MSKSYRAVWRIMKCNYEMSNEMLPLTAIEYQTLIEMSKSVSEIKCNPSKNRDTFWQSFCFDALTIFNAVLMYLKQTLYPENQSETFLPQRIYLKCLTARRLSFLRKEKFFTVDSGA